MCEYFREEMYKSANKKCGKAQILIAKNVHRNSTCIIIKFNIKFVNIAC